MTLRSLMINQTMPPIRHRAFTLIEIIVVIALTTLLFALLLVPLISAIKYTRQLQSLTAAQDAARSTRERLTRELSSAVFVFDNTSRQFVFSGATAPGDDLSTNFLDLDIPTSTQGTTAVAHAYNAKLDFALPRRNDKGVVDPTTGEPIAYSQSGSGSAVIVSPSQVFPAAAGISMVRYWVGLQDPTKPYNNPREANATNANTNTYILYRAQFQPYKKVAGSYVPNPDLFAVYTVNGVSSPELDDPDFFRPVTATDVNWLDDGHLPYTPGEASAHNTRLDTWRTIAKPVIPGPNVDLLVLPRNADGTVAYDNTSAPATPPCTSLSVCDGTAHSGIAHDPVKPANYYPVVTTSVTFRPGTVSGDATPATTTEYTSAGVPLVAGETGLTFIPTVYTAAAQSWSLPYKITLTPPSAPSGQVVGGGTYYVGQDAVTGDTLEYYQVGAAPDSTNDKQVYDLTTATVLSGAGSIVPGATCCIPLSVNADSGTISFDTPSFPDPGNHAQREWVYTPTASGGAYFVDLKTIGSSVGPSPLGTIVDASAKDKMTTNPIPTARLVPRSIRVYGPDGTPGPGNGQTVLYTEASNLNTSDKADNLYTVDYDTSIIHLLGNATQLTSSPVKVIYNYQANMAPVGSGSVAAMTNPIQTPMNISVDYRTRDLLDISLGVRIYDISTGRAQVIPSELKAKIGNSNR